MYFIEYAGGLTMEKNYLIVVDMQKDFVTGTLGSDEACAIVPKIVGKVKDFDGTTIFTKDTHLPNYMMTQEGRNLPVEHCLIDSDGWQLIDELSELSEASGGRCYTKETFGSISLAADMLAENEARGIESIELVGVCTDICVVSNALLLKAYLPEVLIKVDQSCCAGVTKEKHEAALETMRSCQILVY